MDTVGWDELGALTSARQFPARPATVGQMVAATGPVQSQTARSTYLGLAARFPGVTRDEVSRAFADADLVRGSTIRGTVHTATPGQFAALGAATRLGQRRHWTRTLAIADDRLDDLWAATERFASDWRTPEELHEHLVAWLAEHASGESADRAREAGRYLSFGHGSLVRRPASGTGWERQGRPVYRHLPAAAPATIGDLVCLHLRCHGPATRHDLAWWSGLRLREVDEAVDRLDLTRASGPDGRTYLDLSPAPEPGTPPTGVRLLPEFDALLCGYDPRARGRFVSSEHHDVLWHRGNGLMLAPLLVDGRVTGWWRAPGSSRRRQLEVGWFAGTRRPRRSELDPAVRAVEAALDIQVSSISLSRVG